MEVRKQLGSISPHSVSKEDMELINQLAKTALSEEQVYTFAVRLCDNEIDRDWERFDEPSLLALSRLFVGKSGLFDHNWSAGGQTARLYKTEVCQEGGSTGAGDGRRYLKGCAYMLRSGKNSDLIAEIEAGIKKEVSIGCSVARRACSICGQTQCSHQGGQRYDGKLCYFTLLDPTDAYEWSFVAVPAQRQAGVMKGFSHGQEASLKQLLAGRPDSLRQLEVLEKEAQLGRSYMDGLRKELVRLAGLADQETDLSIFSQAVEKLEEPELLELTHAYRRRVDALFPPTPQLHPQKQAAYTEESGAFLV